MVAMDWLHMVLSGMSSETVFFIVLIFIFFVFLNLSFNRRAIAHGPTILTTFGIFGTFVGIAVGLSEFDTSNVREGVPALLSGLKTAFWASVFGVGGALMLKLRMFLFGSGEDDDNEYRKTATVDDVVQALQDLNVSVAGRHEHSLLTQLKLVRQSSDATLTTLRRALDEDAELPAQSAATLTDADDFTAMKAAFADPVARFGKRADGPVIPKAANDETPDAGFTKQ